MSVKTTTPLDDKERTKVLDHFRTLYRGTFDHQAFRKHKVGLSITLTVSIQLEHYNCLTVHCYPLTESMWMRDAPFNMKRAELCARDCSKNMEEVQSMQEQAQVMLLKEYSE